MVYNDSRSWWGKESIRAVTLYPWATMDVKSVLTDLADKNINTLILICKESDGRVFYDSDIVPNQVPGRDLLKEFIEVGEGLNIRIIPQIFTLCDGYLLEQNPDVAQVARDGTKIRYPNVSFEWMHWTCPSHPIVRNHMRSIAEEVSSYDVDGVRFSHIEFQPINRGGKKSLSCFCDRCMEHMIVEDGIDDGEKRVDARVKLLNNLLKDISEPFGDRMVNVQIEVFTNGNSPLGNIRDTFGVDVERMSEFIDVLTPRTSHIDIGLHPRWIRDVVRSLQQEIDLPIVPSIRTASQETPGKQERLEPDELHTAIQMALHGGAAGVDLFSAGANIGRISDEQWPVIANSLEGIKRLGEEYGSADMIMASTTSGV